MGVTSKAAIQDFLAQRTLAVVGVSRHGKGFGHVAYQSLKERGYRVFPVNPNTDTIAGKTIYRSLGALPEPVGGAVIIVPPSQTDQVVRDAARAGIRRVWIQQGCGTDAAVRFCEDNGMTAVHGECILMFLEPVAFLHRVHRWLWGLLGKLPR